MHTNLVKFGRVLCEQTDRQTDRHAHHNTLHPYGGEVIPYNHINERLQAKRMEVESLNLCAVELTEILVTADEWTIIFIRFRDIMSEVLALKISNLHISMSFIRSKFWPTTPIGYCRATLC